MKLKIKVKILTPGCGPEVNKEGDWIDLRAAETVTFEGPFANTLHKQGGNRLRDVVFDSKYIPLGVAMKLPDGCEGWLVPRSGTWKHYKIMQANHKGIVDQKYCGPKDQWHLPAVAFDKVTINKGERICQFRIALSQKATLWQKIKYWLSSGIKLVYVEELYNKDRGGLGHSGVK